MFTINCKELASVIDAAAQIVPQKAVLPAIQNVCLVQDGDSLQVYGTDLETTIALSITVMPDGDGDVYIAVPPKILMDVLRNLPQDSAVSISVVENNRLVVTSNAGEYKITGLTGDNFPVLPEFKEESRVPIPVSELNAILDKVMPFASEEDLKPAMNGVFFDFNKEDGSLTAVATDAHKLSKLKLGGQFLGLDSRILPLKLLRSLPKLIKQSKSDVVVFSSNNTNVRFNFGFVSVIGRMVDARFPDYNNVIPESSANGMICNRNELLATLKRLGVFANKITHLARIKLGGNVFTIETQDSVAHEATETLPCLYEGEEMEIGVNISQLTTNLLSISTDDVIFQMGSPGRAIVILPSVQGEHEHVTLLMPIMLSHGYY